MKEPDNYSLVPTPPGALEKADPGTQRIISGMVAETLAMSKQSLTSKRGISVLIGGSDSFNAMLELIVAAAADGQAKVESEHYESVYELTNAVCNSAKRGHKFDLAFLYVHLFSPPAGEEIPFEDEYETMRRITAMVEKEEIDQVVNTGLLMVGELSGFWQIPVIVLTGSGYPGAEVFVKKAGGYALFPLPSEPAAMIGCVREILGRVIHKQKIFLIDDDSESIVFTQRVIHGFCEPATVQLFGDVFAALEQLPHASPDLIIVAVQQNEFGFDSLVLLNHLETIKARCPVLMQYANDEFLKKAQEVAGSELNVAYLKMPCTYFEFVAAISRTRFNKHWASKQ